MKRILPLVLACIIFMGLQGCSWQQKFHDPEIKVVDLVYLPSNNLLDQRFALRLQMTNPNDLELEVKGIQFKFAIAGIELIEGVSKDVPVIKAYSTTEFTVKGSANMIQAVRLLNKMQKKPDERFSYTLNTRIDLAHGWPSSFNLKRDGDIGLDDWLEKKK